MNLVVDLLDELVLRLLKDSLLDLNVDLLDLLDKVDGALPDSFNLIQDAPNLDIL